MPKKKPAVRVCSSLHKGTDVKHQICRFNVYLYEFTLYVVCLCPLSESITANQMSKAAPEPMQVGEKQKQKKNVSALHR